MAERARPVPAGIIAESVAEAALDRLLVEFVDGRRLQLGRQTDAFWRQESHSFRPLRLVPAPRNGGGSAPVGQDAAAGRNRGHADVVAIEGLGVTALAEARPSVHAAVRFR